MTESLCSSDDEENSLVLFNAIDALGLSRERREISKHMVRHTNFLLETFFKIQTESIEIVGSNREGLFHSLVSESKDYKSDQDFMYLEESITVLDSKDWVDGISQNAHTELFLVAEPDQLFPGYVCLRIPGESSIFGKTYREHKFDKYLNIQRCSKVKAVSAEINGPAITMQYDYGSRPISHVHMYSEFIHCLIYKYWPKEASHWIDRANLSGWPAKDIVEKIISKGCTLAPVGHTDCCYKDEQWRIGIWGEHILFEELNEIQIRCYFILKQILKEDLQNVCGDALSSYHMKNVIFWCAEKFTYNWTPSNFTKCVKLCLEQLEKFLESTILPHFFIQKRNLLNSKLSQTKRLDVIKVLQRYRLNVLDVLKLRSFKKLRTLTNFDEVLMKSSSDKEIINACFGFNLQPYSYFYGAPECLWQRYYTHKTRTCFEIFRDIHRKLISDKKSFTSFTVLNTLYLKNMLGLIYYSFYKSNGSRKARQTAKKLLDESECLPITTIRLRTATFLFMENEFERSMSICDDILKSGTKCKTVVERNRHVNRLHSRIIENVKNLTDPALIIKVKKVILNLFYQRQNEKQTELCPTELKFFQLFNDFRNSIFKDVHYPAFYMGSEKWAVPDVILYELLSLRSVFHDKHVKCPFVGISIDPIFNSYLLNFLINVNKVKHGRRNQIILDMKAYAEGRLSEGIAEYEENKMSKKETIQTLNMLAYFCVKANMHEEAARYLLRSSQIYPQKQNAAYGYTRCIFQILQSIL